MKKFTRIMSMMMVLMLVFSMTACNQNITTPTEEPPVVTEDVPLVDIESITAVENPVTFFSMSMGENYDHIHSMTAFVSEGDTAYVEYITEQKKVGDLDAKIMHGIATEIAKTELNTLNGADCYAEGEANASMYIEFADGTSLIVNYTGEIPESFVNSYTIMDQYFESLTASLDVYVPQPMISGVISENMLNEVMFILNEGGIPNLDGIAISELEVNSEFFSETAGLTNANGIEAAVNAAPMMMSVAYSLTIVELSDGVSIDTVCADFENNIDWMKWVCVAPSNALIATKDNMVLCLQAADDMYTMTVNGIEAAGWAQVNVLDNPNM